MNPDLNAKPFLDELYDAHNTIIFPILFERLTFSMVRSFRCNISRVNDIVTIKSTVFCVAPEETPEASMTLVFDTDMQERVAPVLTSDKLTAATGVTGDVNLVMGYAPTFEQADTTVKALSSDTTEHVLTQAVIPTHTNEREAQLTPRRRNRRRNRRN